MYYDFNTLSSFGVGPMDTVKFAVNGDKERTTRIVRWGTDLIVKQEEVSIDCKDTYIMLIKPSN